MYNLSSETEVCVNDLSINAKNAQIVSVLLNDFLQNSQTSVFYSTRTCKKFTYEVMNILKINISIDIKPVMQQPHSIYTELRLAPFH